MTSIEWTDETWNPTVGCSRVSAGCENCYAERVAHRGMSEQHRGLTVLGKHGPRWNGTVRFLPDRLGEPRRWRKPRRVFVNSMSDLFHEKVADAQIAAVFGVMAACPEHTFQVLTKRPKRARKWFETIDSESHWDCLKACEEQAAWLLHTDLALGAEWPLPNVWLGVSVEDQATADERIPWLLDCPAAVRFVSYEPALGWVDFGAFLDGDWLDVPREERAPGLDWIIVGGESGPGARPFDVAWARSTIAQCKVAGVPCFVKQLGANVRTRNDDNFTIDEDPPDEEFPPWPMRLVADDRIEDNPNGLREEYQGAPVRVRLQDRKGGDMAEWRADLRVREFPEARHA